MTEVRSIIPTLYLKKLKVIRVSIWIQALWLHGLYPEAFQYMISEHRIRTNNTGWSGWLAKMTYKSLKKTIFFSSGKGLGGCETGMDRNEERCWNIHGIHMIRTLILTRVYIRGVRETIRKNGGEEKETYNCVQMSPRQLEMQGRGTWSPETQVLISTALLSEEFM